MASLRAREPCVHKLDGAAPTLLVLSSGERAAARADLIRAVVSPGAGAATAVHPGLDLHHVDAVVLDGAQPELHDGDVERLAAFVRDGGRLLAIAPVDVAPDSRLAELLGCIEDKERLPHGEYFGIVVDPEHALVARLRSDFPFVDSFTPLRLTGESARPLIDVSVHFRNCRAVIERPLEQGTVIVSALGATDSAFDSPEFRTLLRRGLRRPNEGIATRELGVAIVGYGPLGGMGYAHSLGVRATDGLALAAFCDTNAGRLEAAGAMFPEARLYRTVDEVMSDDSVDIAIVATPPSSHTALSLQLLRAGKHVVSEKPLCFSLAEADELIETALSRGLALTVHQNRRWDADFNTVLRAITEGQLGTVFNFETFVGSFEHPCREWHSEATISGGAEFDWGAHYIDWTLQVMGGPPRTVIANGHKRVWHDVSNLDQVRVRMYWDDGREAEFMHSDVAAVRRPKFYVQGTEGTLVGHYRPLVAERIEPGLGYVREESHHAEAPADLTLVRYESYGGLREQRLSYVRPQPFAFYRNLADHLLLDDPPLAVDYRQTRELISVLEAAHVSADQGGRPIALP